VTNFKLVIFIDLEKKLLLCAIEQAEFHDWNNTLIDRICDINNINQDLFYIVFQNGITGLADSFFKLVDEEMSQSITDGFDKLPIHVQVSKLLSTRFNYKYTHKSVVLKILSMPINIKFQISHVLRTSDNIWNKVAHQSNGFDYYTRRMMLSYVYKNCLLHFKKDKSHEDMMDFIAKQLKFIGKITKIKHKFFA
jgi:rpsU-divergently transcribed protein